LGLYILDTLKRNIFLKYIIFKNKKNYKVSKLKNISYIKKNINENFKISKQSTNKFIQRTT